MELPLKAKKMRFDYIKVVDSGLFHDLEAAENVTLAVEVTQADPAIKVMRWANAQREGVT